MIRVLDLFSGIGGFSLGLKRAGGYRTVAYVEIEKACREVIAHHARQGGLDLAPTWDDVETLPRFGGVDLVTAGWPCQGNSISGKMEGMQDARSGLWREVIRTLRDFRPQWFLGENVPGLFSVNGGRDFLQCLRDLDELGYGVCWRVLDAQFFGVPQRRRRVFVVGHLGGVCPPEILLEPEGSKGNPPQGGKAGKDIAFSLRANPSRSGDKGDGGINTTMIAGTVDQKSCSANRGSQANEADFLVARPVEDLVAFDETQITSDKNYSNPKPGDPCHPLAAGARPPSIARAAVAIHADAVSGRSGTAKTPSPDGKGNMRLRDPGIGISEDGKQFTLNASSPHSVAFKMMVRRLTPTECERLQGFPDNWTFGVDSRRYKALGNAVAVPVIEWIGRRLARFGQSEGRR